MNGAPVIALSGEVPSSVLGRGAFQDLDLNAACGNVALSTATLQSGSDHAELVASAAKHAIDHRGVARTRAELETGMARMLAANGPYVLHVVQDGELA